MHPFPSEDALHALMALPSGVVIFNGQDRIAFANPAAVQLLHWDYDRLIGLDREAFCLQFAIPPDLGKEPAAVEIQNCSYQVQHVPFGRPDRRRDLRSQYIFHRETLAQEGLWKIIAGMSHAFREPLAPLVAFAELLRSENIGPLNADQRDILELMQMSEQRMFHAVRQHLLLGALVNGTLWLDTSPLDLIELARESIQRCAQTYADREIVLVSEMPDAQLNLISDAHYLQVGVEQVLDNAFRYTPPGGNIRLSIGVADETITLRIENPGIAFPAAAHARLFCDQLPVNPEPPLLRYGAGIGLMIAARLVNLLGGTIAYTYKPEGFHVFEMRLLLNGRVAR